MRENQIKIHNLVYIAALAASAPDLLYARDKTGSAEGVYPFKNLNAAESGVQALPKTSKPYSPKILGNALDFELLDTSGNQHRLSQYYGTPIILSFCTPSNSACSAVIETIDDVANHYKGRVTAFIVASGKETSIKSYLLRNQKINVMILLDTDGKVGRDYQIPKIPMTFAINKSGKIVLMSISEELKEELKEHGVFRMVLDDILK